MNNCTTHHDACKCREHNFATLIKATLDLFMEFDWIKNDVAITAEKRAELEALISRGHMAIDVVQFKSSPIKLGEITGEHAARMACCGGEDEIEHALRLR